MKPKNKLTKHHLLAEPEFGKAKRIQTWINGENNCHMISINPKDFRSWPPILAHITNIIQPNFGVVKRLVALSSMQSVHSFQDLDAKEKYVALGAQCKLKIPHGGYSVATEKKLSTKKSVKKLFYVGDLNPKSIPFLQAIQKKKLTVVYIAISGKTRPPQKVIFSENDMKDWNLIRTYLARILGISEGVQQICSIYGDVLDDANQFQHGYLYVVVPFTKHFVHMDYISLSGEKNDYRRNFMPPVQPPFNLNSFARAPGLEQRSPTGSPKELEVSYEYEKFRPKKDTVKEERQRVFVPETEMQNIKEKEQIGNEVAEEILSKVIADLNEYPTGDKKTFSTDLEVPEKMRIFSPSQFECNAIRKGHSAE